jgi:hypothetical protein
VSIVIGFAITHVMQGLAGIIQHPGRARIWWVHLVWVTYMLLFAVFWWWFQFGLAGVETWTFARYLFVLGYAFLLYFLSVLVMPHDVADYEGYQDYFLSRRRWFFAFLIVVTLVDLADTLLKGVDHFASLGHSYPLNLALVVAGALLGMVTARPSIHAAIAVVLFVAQLALMLVVFNTVA